MSWFFQFLRYLCQALLIALLVKYIQPKLEQARDYIVSMLPMFKYIALGALLAGVVMATRVYL